MTAVITPGKRKFWLPVVMAAGLFALSAAAWASTDV